MLCLKIQLLSDNGGDGLTNYVKRNMKYLLSPRVAREFNLTGQHGKRALQTLHLNQVLFGKYLLWAPAQRKRATMLYFANVFIYLFIFFYGCLILRPWLTYGGSRKFYTW